jgi:hypothetical protein
MKPVVAHHHLDFTKRDFVVVVADTLEEAVKHFGKHFKSKRVVVSDCKGANALCVVEDNGACAVLFALPALCGSLICHEITHATNAMLTHIGIELDNSSDEAFAYHNDMLFRKVAQLLEKHKITIPLLPNS